MLSCFLVMQESSLSTQFWILLSTIVLRKLVHDCRYELPDRHPFLEGLVFFFSSSPAHSLPCTQTLLHFTLNKVGWSPLFSVVEISEGKSWFKFKSSKKWNADQCIINGSFSVCSPKMLCDFYLILIFCFFSFWLSFWVLANNRCKRNR